ncbi:MAG TPA: DNA methyltransferase [candidate division Zixibacteria bacterium]|nr:DNA methyltransferase [candidate division Zixibacteria bacterium]
MVLDSSNAYVFVPGKNWRLSLAELVAYFEARNCGFESCELTSAFFTIKVEGGLGSSVVADMGGIIKVGKVVAIVATSTVEGAFLRGSKEAQAQVKVCLSTSGIVDEMVEAASGKSVFGVSVYCAERSFHPVSRTIQRFVGSSLKRELAAQGRKSGFMGFPRGRREPQLSHVEVLKKSLVERKAEVLFCIGKEQTVICTTVGVHDPFEFQKRDIGRPIQRKIFGIPPRLARIMINLASCTQGKLLLDPFCGVGTILQEALLTKARVVGVDVNPWCVEASRKNLEWLKKEYALKEAEYAVLQGDSRRLTERIQQEVDCMATEPDLGPALRHVATTPYAMKIIDKLTPLYSDFLEEAHRRLKKDGRLVLVTPYIKTRSGKPVTMHIEERAVTIGFKRVYPFQKMVLPKDDAAHENLTKVTSLVDAEERHKIGREIQIFQE